MPTHTEYPELSLERDAADYSSALMSIHKSFIDIGFVHKYHRTHSPTIKGCMHARGAMPCGDFYVAAQWQ